ncbi:hypothetical protein R1sor_021752 [Riccia sorocarpa]|uniref:RNA polymerase sigma-70 region 4 domain-containing protein n=1 Tax=Riccia sorocarpa TaxID=122646 RepID=A0ABD3GJL8_9MARC
MVKIHYALIPGSHVFVAVTQVLKRFRQIAVIAHSKELVPKKLKSLDMQAGHHKSVLTGDTETFHSLVADQEAENQPWAVVEKAHMKVDVDKMLNTQLGSREREIIKMHYGVDSADGYPMSLETISHRYGVSRERVRQLERAAKRKLQVTNQGVDKYCQMSL